MADVKIPLPGTPVRGSRSGAPVMALLDLLGRPWALGIVWVLAEADELSFNELQSKCEAISPGVLNTRLKELVLAKLVDANKRAYTLTREGHELFELIAPLGRWARRTWAPTLRASETGASGN
ncbi:helix-turn-helix domain-containing protein [uncultured Nitratireductor sp.]|uniref:winged helix-turn-helix transcriptional regulator n=1 Tax=uncultured Nitratireductor sp. TaxID=520953 RepID=UPI0025E3D8A2|nr:helix-turn-helix domain-containing protein [uncultured Nitratireductor sp.]